MLYLRRHPKLGTLALSPPACASVRARYLASHPAGSSACSCEYQHVLMDAFRIDFL